MSTDVLCARASMSAPEYFSKLALSNSGMSDLAISPLTYWYRHVNPNRPEREPTPEQKFGTALHCLVLEGRAAFEERYAPMLNEEDYPDCLFTIDEMRLWLRDKGYQPKGTRKAELIAQVQAVDINQPIWDVLTTAHERSTDGKMLCLAEDWCRIWGAAEALWAEPRVQEILKDGQPEVSLFDNDQDTGIPLKARLDWLSPSCILDLKTFAQRRGKSIDECVADAIYYEGYYRQAYLYSVLHQRLNQLSRPLRFVFAFVESDEPHEVRIRELRPTNYGAAALNVYWQKARIDVRYFCGIWQEYMNEFGLNPWRKEQTVELIRDEELRGMSY